MIHASARLSLIIITKNDTNELCGHFADEAIEGQQE